MGKKKNINYQLRPKQKGIYQQIMAYFEKQRIKKWVKAKLGALK